MCCENKPCWKGLQQRKNPSLMALSHFPKPEIAKWPSAIKSFDTF